MLLAILFVRSSTDYVSKRIGVTIASDVKSDTRKTLLKKYVANSVQLAEKGQTGKK